MRLYNGMVSYVEGQVETAKLRPLSNRTGHSYTQQSHQQVSHLFSLLCIIMYIILEKCDPPFYSFCRDSCFFFASYIYISPSCFGRHSCFSHVFVNYFRVDFLAIYRSAAGLVRRLLRSVAGLVRRLLGDIASSLL